MSDLEEQLRAFRPARPSRELEIKIARELEPAGRPRAAVMRASEPTWLERLLPAVGWTAVGAAAAVVAMLSMKLAEGDFPPKSTATNVTPPPAERVVFVSQAPAVSATMPVEGMDAGVMADPATGVMRRLRVSSLERRTWSGADGAVTVVEIPREDIVSLPVSFQ